MITKIGTVGIYVDNQQAALKFWTEKVGFELRNNIDMGNGMTWMEVAPPTSPRLQRGLIN